MEEYELMILFPKSIYDAMLAAIKDEELKKRIEECRLGKHDRYLEGYLKGQDNYSQGNIWR